MKTIRRAAVIASVLLASCATTQPAFAQTVSDEYACQLISDLAMTAAAARLTGVPLSDALTFAKDAKSATVIRTGYRLVDVAKGESPAHKAAYVGDVTFIACIAQRGAK